MIDSHAIVVGNFEMEISLDTLYKGRINRVVLDLSPANLCFVYGAIRIFCQFVDHTKCICSMIRELARTMR
jgi:hypothetical protein